MYHIQTNEHTIKDKIIIANKYLIPRRANVTPKSSPFNFDLTVILFSCS